MVGLPTVRRAHRAPDTTILVLLIRYCHFAIFPPNRWVTGSFLHSNVLGWGFWIKVICVCVWGPDLGSRLPRFKPSWELALGLNDDVGQFVDAMIAKVERAPPGEMPNRCRCIGRKLIRSAFCLVMPVERIWTDDISLSAHLFAKHYPGQRDNIAKAARWATNPTGTREEALELLQHLRVNIASEFERKKEIHDGQRQ